MVSGEDRVMNRLNALSGTGVGCEVELPEEPLDPFPEFALFELVLLPEDVLEPDELDERDARTVVGVVAERL
jgi:hypothetical protein